MYNDMKKDEVLIPHDATVENITTETEFYTYYLPDENFVKAAIAELEHLVVHQQNHLKM